jgi:putative hydrolase of HD superfamily
MQLKVLELLRREQVVLDRRMLIAGIAAGVINTLLIFVLTRAADRIFGLLPPDLGAEFRMLWEEFEAAATPDAVFAKALDRVQPVMQNIESGGGTWVTYNVTAEQLDSRVGVKIARGAPALWDWVRTRSRRFFDG